MQNARINYVTAILQYVLKEAIYIKEKEREINDMRKEEGESIVPLFIYIFQVIIDFINAWYVLHFVTTKIVSTNSLSIVMTQTRSVICECLVRHSISMTHLECFHSDCGIISLRGWRTVTVT